MNNRNPEIISIDSKSDVVFEDALNDIIGEINISSQRSDKIDYQEFVMEIDEDSDD